MGFQGRYERLGGVEERVIAIRPRRCWLINKMNGRFRGIKLSRTRKLNWKAFSSLVKLPRRIARIYGEIVNKMKNMEDLEEDENFVDVVNPCTRKETPALGDSNMRNLKCGDVLQLERKGYFRCHVPFLIPTKRIVLFAIPDGRQQPVLRFAVPDGKTK
ncbi:hypothetical protein K7X08_009241 [Anisodus acutangulus]|uniref:tRNA synthetases class I (E and Q) anti-codon binding domain-containing protein n=1 Tax=Anisodus acutangulus TaxID=402998 RepID=A0A9Q1MZE8_9SOLA|nr:hypothetical protein K7X08_009241 [Anisodus acutangulus]